MASWPEGHRWEDYTIHILDRHRHWLGTLETCQKMAGKRGLYGQFGCELTFALEARDPWASVLQEEELHYIQALRDDDGVAFEGFQIKIDREDTLADKKGEQWIEFAFVPLAFIMHWRVGLPTGKVGSVVLSVLDRVDDGFKLLVERTFGVSAPTTITDNIMRYLTGIIIDPPKTEYPANVQMDCAGQDMYEFLQQYGEAYKVDWDCYFDADWNIHFQTWYPRRGVNRSEGVAADADVVVLSDVQGDFTSQTYGVDTGDLVTVAYASDLGYNETANRDMQKKWGLREAVVGSKRPEEVHVMLENRGPKRWYQLKKYEEQEGAQWQHKYNVGDKVTWNSVRLGYGPKNDPICRMDWQINEGGKEELTPCFGEPEPDILDKLRGGGRGRNTPSYTLPPVVFATPALTFGVAHVAGVLETVIASDSAVALGITCPDVNTVYPDAAASNRWSLTSVGATITITGAVANTVNFEVVPGAGGWWTRDAINGELYPTNIADQVGIGTPNPVEMLDIFGNINLRSGDQLLWSAADIFVEADAGAIMLAHVGDAYVFIDSNNNGANEFFAVLHNGTTFGGATELMRIGENGRMGIGDPAPGHLLDVAGDIDVHTGSGYMINDTATNRHVLIGDGTRGVFRALVTADLPAPAAHDILSAQHGDTLAAAVSRGSMIYGNATPAWAELVLGAASTHLESDGADVSWVTSITLASGEQVRVDANVFLEMDAGASMLAHAGDVYMFIDSNDNGANEFFAILHDGTTFAGATELMRVQENGNVGIGIVPTTRTHIYINAGGINPQMLLEQDGAGDAAMRWLLTGGQSWSAGIDNSDSDSWKLASNVNVSTQTRVTVTTAGRVGINDASPDAMLDIVCNAAATAALRLEGAAGQTADMLQIVNNAGGELVVIEDDGRAIFQNDADSTTGFQIFDADGGIVIFNVDTTNERVGLGLNNPAYQLHGTGAAAMGYDTDTTSFFGRAAIGYDGATADIATFAHIDMNALASAALRQSAVGNTYLNAANTREILFRVNNADRMIMNVTVLKLYSGQDFEVYSDAGVALKASIDGATGNLSLRSNAEIRFYDNGNYVGFEAPGLAADQIWALPNVDGGAGTVLTTNGGGALSWTAPTPAAHNLLSAQHGDTVTSAMTRGDIVIGTAGGWDDLSIGTANAHLESNGNDPSWVVNISMAALATVDGVDVSAHTHGLGFGPFSTTVPTAGTHVHDIEYLCQPTFAGPGHEHMYFELQNYIGNFTVLSEPVGPAANHTHTYLHANTPTGTPV